MVARLFKLLPLIDGASEESDTEGKERGHVVHCLGDSAYSLVGYGSTVGDGVRFSTFVIDIRRRLVDLVLSNTGFHRVDLQEKAPSDRIISLYQLISVLHLLLHLLPYFFAIALKTKR